MSAIRIMFGAAAAIVALSLIAQGPTGAAQPEKGREPATQRERVLAAGEAFEWNADDFRGPVRLRAGELELLVTPVQDLEGLIFPRVRISRPGMKPAVLDGERSGAAYSSRISVGRWDKGGALFVLLESYTGGAHCCTRVQAAVPKAGGFEISDLDAYDGERLERLPSDVDGDGAVDFVVTDDSFLYAFSSYAGSFAPPKILNIADGTVVDVSARKGFAAIFADAMQKSRGPCAEGEPGYCAGYAAAAARAGRFDEALPDVLRFMKGKVAAESLPTDCRVETGDAECPEAETVRYVSYEEALKAFLAKRGYIRS